MYQLLGVVTQWKVLRLTSESMLTGMHPVQFGTSNGHVIAHFTFSVHGLIYVLFVVLRACDLC